MQIVNSAVAAPAKPLSSTARIIRSSSTSEVGFTGARLVLDHLGIGILVIEQDLSVSLVNVAFERMTGCRRNDLLGTKSWMELLELSGDADMSSVLRGPQPVFHARLHASAGGLKDVTLRISVIPGTMRAIVAVAEVGGSNGPERHLAEDLTRKESEQHLREENVLLRSSLRERYRFGAIIGKSPAMQRVYEMILNAAGTDANVILYGESGTGKELVARAIHETSRRKSASFVPVNCGAIPETLMESEFFGYRKGAFTGAVIDKHGFLDLAHGGTLFLDELGDIGHSMQVKLLRAIDGGGYTPVGGTQARVPDLRIIAATNRDILDQVRRGSVREDFFYRIHVIPIHLPPLRERCEDIPLLVEHFIAKFRTSEAPPVTPRVLEKLMAHDWPGNVRELQNTVYRYLTLKKLDFAGFVRPAQEIPQPAGFMPEPAGGNLDAMVELFEKKLILRALERHRWQREVTAEALGIHRKTLFTKMKRYGLAAGGAFECTS
jgi:transcriptional regulator with PAS, ATPase and Fis domain